MHLKERKRIVFIGHEASLSGAPILLLNLLLLLKKESKVEIFLVIKRYGDFFKNYENHFSCMVLKGKDYGKEISIFKRIFNVGRNRIQLVRLFFKSAFADVIFSNTITNGRILKTLSPFKKKIVTYVHEMENVIEWYRASGGSAYSLQLSHRFAYPSLKVSETLQYKYLIDKSKLYRLLYYFPVDLLFVNDEVAIKNFRNAFKAKFNLTDTFLVGNVGVLCERKGTDFFIEVCSKVTSRNKNIKFCWIGQFEDEKTENELKYLIRKRAVSDNIILTGPLAHHYYNFSSFDLLFLSSREDPYPLVVLEAAFMKIPAICFEDSGGITEFINDDAGWIINNFSIDDAAEKIIDLFNDRQQQVIDKGKAAFQKALNLHANKAIVLDQFNELINGL